AGAIHEADGTVYYVNQMGVAAAADLRTGRLRWLATYDSIELEATFYQEPVLRDLVWGPSPLLLLGHVLVLAPRDSAYLYALDTGRGPAGPAAGGKVLWRHGASDGGLRDLLGFHRGLLYFTGSSQGMGPGEITALDLRGMDAYGNLPPDGGGDGPRRAASLRCPGRIPSAGVLTSSGVLFADEEGLKLADLDLTGIRDLSPGPFPPPSDRGTYPGRLQVAGGLVLMTSRSILSAHAPAAEGPAR
ncbi:MAG: hypothetical protein HY721_10840, partial [Planctomycetes bacterium]|nr:hypothetical protein [Planctomycetota bacterium]